MHKRAMPAGRQGFVLAEIIVVMGIMALLFGIVYIRATNIERHASLPAFTNGLIAELRGQQTKAMSGDAVSGVTLAQGIHFQTNQYVLFQGSSFDEQNPSNVVVPFPDTISTVSITFPSATIHFAKGSGEILGYSDQTNTVTLGESSTGKQSVITVNRYGSVISVE